MLEKILRLYTLAMNGDVRSPLPHLFGPPGCGKSTAVAQAAELLGVKLHTINLSRVSPLELEGVQMPVTEEEMKLRLLHATYWTALKPGDILLFDEFLRAFPEVMNGLLDIITSREVAGLNLPPVFIIAASNSTIAYDKALEDRLLHLPVTDPRKSQAERTRMAELIVDAIGLMPEMVSTMEMQELIHNEVLPMYNMLDQLKKRSAPPATDGRSVRNLIGQAQLREIQSVDLSELITANNLRAEQQQRWQYYYVVNASRASERYPDIARNMLSSGKLNGQQARNTRMNLELIELAGMNRSEGEDT